MLLLIEKSSLIHKNVHEKPGSSRALVQIWSVQLPSSLTAVQRDFIWEEGSTDELVDLQLSSAFSIHTDAILSTPTEVTSRVNSWGPAFLRVIHQGEGLPWQQAITRAAPTQPIPSPLQPLHTVTYRSNSNVHWVCLLMGTQTRE